MYLWVPLGFKFDRTPADAVVTEIFLKSDLVISNCSNTSWADGVKILNFSSFLSVKRTIEQEGGKWGVPQWPWKKLTKKTKFQVSSHCHQVRDFRQERFSWLSQSANRMLVLTCESRGIWLYQCQTVAKSYQAVNLAYQWLSMATQIWENFGLKWISSSTMDPKRLVRPDIPHPRHWAWEARKHPGWSRSTFAHPSHSDIWVERLGV